MTSSDVSVVPPARQWWTLIPFLVAVIAVAGVGGLAAAGSQATYRALDLPPFAPPSWLFGPVWSVLYLTIGVAGWLLWRAGGWDRVMWLWTVQLVLNLAWTPLFFAADLYTVALVEIVVLAASVGLLIAWSWRRSRVAAWLLVPYLAWVCFATALNAGIVVLN
ncbi:TspO/MBR family protein [Nocardioides hwasunensis]|uniref:Tryptophan-rich sensory protein n=1 Tax=Nocardioides hwasunensis TaxID=397258 RepID=A0ABR8MLC0_9ACTN|nr:TspO/MBR family protein [Nocardioides hwasunensis]MBD3915314.1 tryptophan-rich sensory protein [Nocardioides hwasunensis]